MKLPTDNQIISFAGPAILFLHVLAQVRLSCGDLRRKSVFYGIPVAQILAVFSDLRHTHPNILKYRITAEELSYLICRCNVPRTQGQILLQRHHGFHILICADD